MKRSLFFSLLSVSSLAAAVTTNKKTPIHWSNGTVSSPSWSNGTVNSTSWTNSTTNSTGSSPFWTNSTTNSTESSPSNSTSGSMLHARTTKHKTNGTVDLPTWTNSTTNSTTKHGTNGTSSLPTWTNSTTKSKGKKLLSRQAVDLPTGINSTTNSTGSSPTLTNSTTNSTVPVAVPYTIVVHLYTLNSTDAISKASAKLQEASQVYSKDKETLSWFVMQSVSDPRAFTIVERYAAETSQQYHLNNPYWLTFDPYVKPLLSQEMDLRRYNELDTSTPVKVVQDEAVWAAVEKYQNATSQNATSPAARR